MHQALTSPVFRSLAIGSVVLGLSIAMAAKQPQGRRLVLHARSAPHALYLTAWRHGDVKMPYDGDELVPLTFTTRASVNDGCRWMATETLVPVGPARYAYRYDETLLECDADATPCIKTPRTGYVTVEK
jgi:hypothetical protein